MVTPVGGGRIAAAAVGGDVDLDAWIEGKVLQPRRRSQDGVRLLP
jgi:hypothetical protein